MALIQALTRRKTFDTKRRTHAATRVKHEHTPRAVMHLVQTLACLERCFSATQTQRHATRHHGTHELPKPGTLTLRFRLSRPLRCGDQLRDAQRRFEGSPWSTRANEGMQNSHRYSRRTLASNPQHTTTNSASPCWRTRLRSAGEIDKIDGNACSKLQQFAFCLL